MIKILLLLILFFQSLSSKESNVETYFYNLFPPENYALQEKDIRNGYIKFYPKMAEGFGEFVIWKLKDKFTLAGVVLYSCGPACYMTRLDFYHFAANSKEGEKVTHKVFDKKKMEALYKKAFENVTARGGTGDETLWVKLPKKGRDIEFGIMQGQVEKNTFIKVGIAKFNGQSFDIFPKKIDILK